MKARLLFGTRKVRVESEVAGCWVRDMKSGPFLKEHKGTSTTWPLAGVVAWLCQAVPKRFKDWY